MASSSTQSESYSEGSEGSEGSEAPSSRSEKASKNRFYHPFFNGEIFPFLIAVS